MTDLYPLIMGILSALFDRETAQLERRTQGLLARHVAMGGSKDGFRHLGMVTTNLTGTYRSRGTYDPLKPALVPEMDSIRTERVVLQRERDRIKQALVLVLKGVESAQDIRDALPNCMQDVIPQCRGLNRTREEAYTLQDNPRGLSQYMMIRDKMEFYVGARLLY